AYTLAGLAAILVVASGPAPQTVLDGSQSVAVAAATITVIAFLARPGAKPGLRHATGSGIVSGVASALTQTVTVALTEDGALPLYQVLGIALLVAAFATAGLLLSQTAYQDGLGAPLAMVTLANPVAAAAIGLTLLGERLQGGAAGILLAVAGAALAGYGVVLLSRATPEPAVLPESRTAVVRESYGYDAAPDDEAHPVAVVLALCPESASQEPALLPRPTAGPGQLTAL
ncbi:hypothetical protein ACVNF4_36490, partial [Streptomyces sp. S6]